MTRALVAFTMLAATMATAPPADAHGEGRRVDFGPWNGVIACESGGDADVYNWQGSGAAGLFQFMPSTWDWVAKVHRIDSLVGVDPTSVPIARQFRHAMRLRDMRGGGIRHWACGFRYGDGTGPIWVHDDVKPTRPWLCVRRLVRYWDLTRRQAKQVCAA